MQLLRQKPEVMFISSSVTICWLALTHLPFVLNPGQPDCCGQFQFVFLPCFISVLSNAAPLLGVQAAKLFLERALEENNGQTTALVAAAEEEGGGSTTQLQT